ncbi:hypothetical protein AAJ76_4200029028 [Vairimorpha ceranae]|uniref:GIT Spa2 homology (SHD) domain-containing protein n=1 Tax=Vairimorpha ceranae TaxID=40302 RepID=A0A0F9WPJ0_9MICR|nr:hypothetical protein AAJ76_4200029028 [Vairimorpha ceranae]KAF5139934.1 hypothetical protein G9O61_00g018540 [Vairimorpha ceranae]KKO74858.1 hypothetical protein AAJ76_4200029028 [Vairimorpha ceranae]
MDKEITRYTLKSYLEDHINTTPYEQKAATIGKVKKLISKDFKKFVFDIVNEIHRRTNLDYKKPGNHRMRKRLLQMKEETFKNLVFDTLEVFNERYKNNINSLDDDIENISKLVSALKTEENINEKIFNETNITLKYKYFLEYINQKYNTKKDKIFEYMSDFTNKTMEEEIDDSCDIMFNYKIFIEKLNRSKYAQLEKYKVYSNNISRLENMELDKFNRKELIGGEFLNILKLIIDNQYCYEESIINRNVNHLINTIQKIDYLDKSSFKRLISTEIKKEDSIDIKETVINILENCKEMSFVNTEYIAKLLSVKSKKLLTYEDILNIVNLIRNILEDIKNDKKCSKSS